MWAKFRALSPRARALRIGAGTAAYCAGIGIVYEVAQPLIPLPSTPQRCCTFQRLAPNYDEEVDRDEKTSGILELRDELISHARGRVLELATGTGRNLEYYQRSSATDLVATDNCGLARQ